MTRRDGEPSECVGEARRTSLPPTGAWQGACLQGPASAWCRHSTPLLCGVVVTACGEQLCRLRVGGVAGGHAKAPLHCLRTNHVRRGRLRQFQPCHLAVVVWHCAQLHGCVMLSDSTNMVAAATADLQILPCADACGFLAEEGNERTTKKTRPSTTGTP